MRLFIAFELDDPVRRELERCQRQLRKISPYGLSLVKPEQMHITLQFLGEIPEEHLGEIKKACTHMAQEMQPFEFPLGPLSCQPNHTALRLVWMRVSDQNSLRCFSHCYSVSAQKLKGLVDLEQRDEYLPHITVARAQRDNRFQQQLRDSVSTLTVAALVQAVKSLTLYESKLSVHGATHEVLQKDTLSAAW